MNKDLESILGAPYKQIKEWHKHVNPALRRRLDSRGFNKKYVKAKDVYLYDDEGNEYIDFLGGYGLNNVGHNHPRIKRVIEDFLKSDNPIFMQAAILPGPGALAQKLYEVSGLENCFFCNSGTEAVEGAIKLARKATAKRRIVSCCGAFHGKTLGSLSISGRRKYKDPFEPLIPGCIQVPYGDAKVIEVELKKGDVACVAIEPVQGEAGIIVPLNGYLKDVEELCRKYDTLLFIDEIQTGLGRTGKMFAYQYEDVRPDILTLAKGLSGTAIPIGVLVGKGEVYKKAYGNRKVATAHTSTFGGNNLATLVALTTLKIIEEESLAENAAKQGSYLLAKLNSLKKAHPKLIRDVRGRGLMLGVELKEKGASAKLGGKINEVLFDENICSVTATVLLNKYRIITAYTLNNTDVLRLEPPLTIKKEHVDRLIDSFEGIMRMRFWGTELSGGKIMADSLFKR